MKRAGRPVGMASAPGPGRAPAPPPGRARLGIAVTVLLAGCSATAEFHRHFEAGRFPEAAAAFEADSSLREDDRAVFRAALVLGLPGSPAYDRARAIDELERLLALHPGTAYREQAVRMLALLREAERLEREMEDRMREARSLAAELAEARDRARERERQLEERERDAAVLRRLAERLEAQLREREREIETLREELERLKEIDLGRQPPREP